MNLSILRNGQDPNHDLDFLGKLWETSEGVNDLALIGEFESSVEKLGKDNHVGFEVFGEIESSDRSSAMSYFSVCLRRVRRVNLRS
jgi:hypothetical protein